MLCCELLLLELLFFFDLLPLLELSDLVFEELLPEDFADEVLDFLVDLPLPELLLFKEFEVLSEESLPDSIFDVDFFLFFFERGRRQRNQNRADEADRRGHSENFENGIFFHSSLFRLISLRPLRGAADGFCVISPQGAALSA